MERDRDICPQCDAKWSSGGWVHFGNDVLATEHIFQKKGNSGDMFNNIAHEPMLPEALKWEAGATA